MASVDECLVSVVMVVHELWLRERIEITGLVVSVGLRNSSMPAVLLSVMVLDITVCMPHPFSIR